ncbi:uncharacterized protein METZ01_LOCUS432300, partial [marine metagenome]
MTYRLPVMWHGEESVIGLVPSLQDSSPSAE